MSMKLRASSGTYNVRASEMAREKVPAGNKTVRCIVRFLDDTEHGFDIDKRAKAQHLLDKVFEHLELIEKDYFGCQYLDTSPGPDGMLLPNEQFDSEFMRWLDPLKVLKKQIRVPPPYLFFFRVKFYVSDPSKLHEEYTRYHFFLQVKKDILEGRLKVPISTAASLASYAVQSELGDYNAEEHTNGYLQEFKFIPNQSEEFEKEVAKLHKTHKGQNPADAEFNYLDRAKRLEMYGVDLHNARVRDQSNLEIMLGVTSVGLVVFQNSMKINTFSWAKIVKISFKRRQFFIQLRRELVSDENDSVENLIGFNMNSYRSCKNLWKSCVEHHTFFRLHTPLPPKKYGLFSLGSKFRYSGRTEYQTIEDSKRRARVERSFSSYSMRFGFKLSIGSLASPKTSHDSHEPFSRSPSKRYARRTVGGTTRDVISEERNVIDRRKNAPQRPGSESSSKVTGIPNSNSVPHIKHYETYNNHVSQPSSAQSSLQRNSNGRPPRKMLENKNAKDTDIDDDGGFLSRVPRERDVTDRARDSYAPTLPPKNSGYMDDDDGKLPQAVYDLPMYNEITVEKPFKRRKSVPNGSAYQEGLVSIKMKPDDQGRFGFNVKTLENVIQKKTPSVPVTRSIRTRSRTANQGGADQGMPIIVSRVAPNTPADLCIPRLNEGDQVLFINGRDVSQHTHEQVVMFIRASRETHSGELVLVVRPNVYVGDDTIEEPDFQYIPDTHHISSTLPQSDLLGGSLMLLQEALESGAALAQFEQLYRKKPGMTMQAARQSENIPKNRYRDISPYDQTRVKLKASSSGDYINANVVHMEIVGSGIVNRYIAAQGPLPNTVTDFWQMAWEQQSTLVVMLTSKIERGRVKCHQYWPDLYETADLGQLQLSCVKEEETPSFAFREFTLVNMETNEERHVRQMQYIAWPDHGVPEDSADFLDFILRVRQNRLGMTEPTIVHCSAGIGRTGVLITMETAMCLVEANQPIYPLDIVRQMRDQRAMLIQTASQYKFVCEAILRVYHDGIVKPLDEYSKS
ncbi:tyrosine-protein phosphatase non-receptor type 4-like isoform X4 [Lineus longissimus]|uniref:tyrosine-protein phosphatase non-receptor type 4-like isoform X4 n=1 Tax=Lineus longissimus TaxID=88925 RepID=UPI00315DE718